MRLPSCPDCGTELTRIPNRSIGRTRRGGVAGYSMWCWKCERYLRLGEQRRAEDTLRTDPPVTDTP